MTRPQRPYRRTVVPLPSNAREQLSAAGRSVHTVVATKSDCYVYGQTNIQLNKLDLHLVLGKEFQKTN